MSGKSSKYVGKVRLDVDVDVDADVDVCRLGVGWV